LGHLARKSAKYIIAFTKSELLNLLDSEGTFDSRIVYSAEISVGGAPITNCFNCLRLVRRPVEHLGLHQVGRFPKALVRKRPDLTFRCTSEVLDEHNGNLHSTLKKTYERNDTENASGVLSIYE
jgi:hypothetical protein